MKPLESIADWFDIRKEESRTVLLAIIGAFLVLGYLILSRSLREALYLATFDVTTLPYVMATVAILGLPTVGFFARLLARYNSRTVLKGTILLTSIGLTVLWPLVFRLGNAIVIFYLWTALSAMVLTSGFWVVVSEYFALRSAKRLYGLIAAGGTAGAMTTGTSLNWLTQNIEMFWLYPILLGLLGCFFVVQVLMPSSALHREEMAHERTPILQGLALVARNNHLRNIGLIVMTATMATTLLDYQFKELVRSAISSKEGLASFFGAFYGWCGAASLIIQLFLTSRIMSVAGVGWSLAVLPLIVFSGSVGILFAPSLFLITAIRGADNSLRKSLYRAMIEVLYVPIPSLLRRKTKTFIDSVLDSISEGIGAGLLFLWVTWAQLPSRFLSIFVMTLTAIFCYLARRMNREYFKTLSSRLAESRTEVEAVMPNEPFDGRDLLSMTFSHLDLRKQLEKRGIVPPHQVEPTGPTSKPLAIAQDTLSRIESNDISSIMTALREARDWNIIHVPALVRLLAQDSFYEKVTPILVELGKMTLPLITKTLKDQEADFAIRRRIPRVLSRIKSREADDALLDALGADRFEIRYRAAIALVQRRAAELPTADGPWQERVWKAVFTEVGRDRPIWEMQRLLDTSEDFDDQFMENRVGIRGELSLEHTFRMLTLVLDQNQIRLAYRALIIGDEKMKSLALEYLHHILPKDIRQKLWPFIGDISEHLKDKSRRPIKEVVADLLASGTSLFRSEEEMKALQDYLDDKKV